jgi:predicted ATP-dependent endonuclease of OLD family
MVVGIFEAWRQLSGEFGTVLIEEPEMYLHPQAQRYFYRLLCEMTEKKQCQVIYSTHSPIFADVNRFEALRLVRGAAGRTTVAFVQHAERETLNKARGNFKLGNRFDASRNEILFARKALLTEGYGDRIAALMIADKMNLDLDAEGLAVVDCGGKNGIVLVARVCRALQIPFVVLHDDDIWPTDEIADEERRKKLEQENKAEEKKNREIKDAVGVEGLVHVISTSLEAVLGIGRDASDKPRRIAEKMSKLTMENIPQELQPLLKAVRSLVSENNESR